MDECCRPSIAIRARAWRLELLTVGWNVVEGVVSVWAALAAGSVALLGFGIDSFVETASGLVMLWRLHAEKAGMSSDDVARLDARAHRLIGASLLLLAAWIAFDASWSLWRSEQPTTSLPGIVITAVSLVVMAWLAGAKRRAAVEMGSRALAADSFQTTACMWLSAATLAGLGLNALLGWWWADPLAALALSVLIAREGRAALRGESCCD
jgi:divalent metal cation (Fe/Co/Zn/Cd) transporter